MLVENVVETFTSTEVLELLTSSKNVLFFKLRINEISNKPKSIELNELAEKCSKNSIVLFLMTKNAKSFCLFWKSKEIKFFLELKLYDNCEYFNDLRLFEFIANFVADALKHGYLGKYLFKVN